VAGSNRNTRPFELVERRPGLRIHRGRLTGNRRAQVRAAREHHFFETKCGRIITIIARINSSGLHRLAPAFQVAPAFGSVSAGPVSSKQSIANTPTRSDSPTRAAIAHFVALEATLRTLT
jgi:hypothetical protein